MLIGKTEKMAEAGGSPSHRVKIFKCTISLTFAASSLTLLKLVFQAVIAHTEVHV
jgi:hypothetical protein